MNREPPDLRFHLARGAGVSRSGYTWMRGSVPFSSHPLYLRCDRRVGRVFRIPEERCGGQEVPAARVSRGNVRPDCAAAFVKRIGRASPPPRYSASNAIALPALTSNRHSSPAKA